MSVYYFKDLKIRRLPSEGFDNLEALKRKYLELDGKNQELIKRMETAQAINSPEEKALAYQEVVKLRTAQWREFVPLMEYASRHPTEDISLKAAILTLMSSSDGGRDMACKLIVDHHIESKEIGPALGRMLYTYRSRVILPQVIEKNKHPSVIAHAKVALAEAFMRNKRPEAERLLREVLKDQPDLKYRAPYWGPEKPMPTFGEAATKLLAKMKADDAKASK